MTIFIMDPVHQSPPEFKLNVWRCYTFSNFSMQYSFGNVSFRGIVEALLGKSLSACRINSSLSFSSVETTPSDKHLVHEQYIRLRHLFPSRSKHVETVWPSLNVHGRQSLSCTFNTPPLSMLDFENDFSRPINEYILRLPEQLYF